MKDKHPPNYSPEAIINRVTELVIQHSENRSMLTDDQISDIRANLATGAFFMVENVLQPLYEELIVATGNLHRAKKKAYLEELESQQSAGFTISVARDMASKLYEANEEYIQAILTHVRVKNEIAYADKLLSAVKECLNSMSKRNKI